MSPHDVDSIESAGGPVANEAGVERRRAVVILEVLAGLRGATDAAQDLGIALQAYYQLEERAVKGLVVACEPRPPGPKRDYQKEAELLQKEKDRLQAENARYQALVRTSQLSVGIDPDKTRTRSTKKRNRQPTVRALRAINQIESKRKPR